VRRRRQRSPAASLPRQPVSSSCSFSRLPLGLLSLQRDDRCGAMQPSDLLPRSLRNHFAIAPLVQMGSLPGRVSSCPLERPVPLWSCMTATAAAGDSSFAGRPQERDAVGPAPGIRRGVRMSGCRFISPT
jgi:hypothetical protein